MTKSFTPPQVHNHQPNNYYRLFYIERFNKNYSMHPNRIYSYIIKRSAISY